MSDKQSILSLIQPTGDLHFGNYFGAIEQWTELQKEYNCFYGVADYHAMTMPYKPQKLREATWEMIINLIALGVEKENLFIQSLVPEHAELNWVLNCFCSHGQLTRMTQFKDKSDQSGNKGDGFISAGLFDYPVLQAADILIYRADKVPVGKDQKQHLELARQIARRFNKQVGKDYLTVPDILYSETPRIASPADPKIKMSKSKGAKHYISTFADESRLRKQIRSAVTGSEQGNLANMSPGVKNLLTLLGAAGNTEQQATFIEDFKREELRFVDLKDATADALNDLCAQFRLRKNELNENRSEVKNIVKESSARIRKRAAETVREVKSLAGLMNV